MVSLQIDLQEGFSGESVTISIDGDEVFSKENVKTRMQIGLADRIEASVKSGLVSVQVSIPSRGLAKNIDLHAAQSPYLGISLTSDGISHKESSEQFRYM